MVAGQAPLRAQLNQKELTVKRKPSRVNNTLQAGGIQTQERQEGGAVAANKHPGQVGHSFLPFRGGSDEKFAQRVRLQHR